MQYGQQQSRILYLVEGTDVYSTAQRDVFRVEAVDSQFFQPLLSKGVVAGKRRWQNGWHNKSQNVEAIEQNFVYRPLCSTTKRYRYVIFDNSVGFVYPNFDPDVERICHPNQAQTQKHVERSQEIPVEPKVQRRREQDGPHQFALGCHETCEMQIWYAIYLFRFVNINLSPVRITTALQ